MTLPPYDLCNNHPSLELWGSLQEIMNELSLSSQPFAQISHLPDESQCSYDEALRVSDDFQDVFTLVKRVVKEYLGKERPRIVLHLINLPLHIGAAHPVGTDRILMNDALLEIAVKRCSLSDVKAFVFSILLHEYIHSLGCINEYETRRLVFLISRAAFGPGHLVTQLARHGPWHVFVRTPYQA